MVVGATRGLAGRHLMAVFYVQDAGSPNKRTVLAVFVLAALPAPGGGIPIEDVPGG